MKYELMNPRLLEIPLPGGELAMGGSQSWYPGLWKRISGCGPTAASNLIWYMARSRSDMGLLWDTGNGEKSRFLGLMLEFFAYLTPGLKGVNKSSIFTSGVNRFCADRGVELQTHVLEIPKAPGERPDIDTASNFIVAALQADSPVGFLNLNSGTESNLEAWHWVTVIGLETETKTAVIIDKGRSLEIHLDEWLETSKLGGAMVYLQAKE